MAPQRFNHAAFANAGRSGYADAKGIAGVRETGFEYVLRQLRVIGPRTLDERDSARKHGAIAAHNPVNILIAGEAPAAFDHLG
jgi:hypothetical protein